MADMVFPTERRVEMLLCKVQVLTEVAAGVVVEVMGVGEGDMLGRVIRAEVVGVVRGGVFLWMEIPRFRNGEGSEAAVRQTAGVAGAGL